MSANYEPITLDVRMSDYGYWVVTYSLAPGLRLAVMVCRLGLTQQEAAAFALPTLSAYPAKRGQ